MHRHKYPNKSFPFWGRSGTCPKCKEEMHKEKCDKCETRLVRDTCTGCGTECGRGVCFFCYGQDRWEHIHQLRGLLEKVGMWKNGGMRDADAEKYPHETVPLASTLHIACPSLADKGAGEELLKKVEKLLKVRECTG